jgi:hypothetical protein
MLALAGLLAAAAIGWPDLHQEPPFAVSLRPAGGRSLLVFGSAVDVAGGGPLVLHGSRRAGQAEMAVSQLVRRGDGGWFALPLQARLRYVVSRTHRHWHLQAFERYELRRARDGRLVGTARKAGFCLGDRYRLGLAVSRPGEPDNAVYLGECGRGRPGARGIVQGISIGYGDDYPPQREGQYVDVAGLSPGRYVLVHRADPERLLHLQNRRDDVASALVELRGGPRPSAVVLRRCPASATCGTRPG